MHIFRLFFVSTVLIPVLVVVAASDEGGIRLRKPRNVVISEDGARTARRIHPVNISDSCPSLGCTGNLTNTFNGKGSLASTLLPNAEEQTSPKPRRSDSFVTTTRAFHHDTERPLKLEIRSIKNSTRSDQIADSLDIGTARGETEFNFNSAVVLSWTVFWAWKALVGFLIIYAVNHCWNIFRKTFGIGDDYIEYYVKLGKDAKHPFGSLGGGWNPTFGISLKSKVEEHKPQQKGWGWPEQYPHYNGAYASSYHTPHEGHWPPPHYGGSQDYGWHMPSGWKGWKSESQEEEDNLRHKFDKKKGWKYAQKYTKKYGKKAHKYGLRPSKYSYMFDKKGNIILGNKGENYAWRRRK